MRKEVKIGIYAVVILLAAWAGIRFLSGLDVLGRSRNYNAHYESVNGLQDAAEKYVSKFPNLTKISVTGSSGKTTTKELLVSVFVSKFGDDVVYTKGNFNSETGLPLSVFNIRENHKIGIFANLFFIFCLI